MRRCSPSTIATGLALTALTALGLGLGLGLGDAGADRGPDRRRAGRAVRVPRTSAALTTNARFCAMSEDDHGICFAAVAVGDAGSVMSTDGSHWGQTEIVEVTPNLNRCGQADSWNIRIDRARLKSSYYDYGAILVVGMTLSSEAQLMSAARATPDHNQLASVMYVVDADGDAQADLIADQYGCDLARRAVRQGDPSHQCFEYWVAVRDRWQRGRVDHVATCTR